jgi:2-dehydropantoate 2-reductase
MRFIIYGVGAIGGTVAAALAHSGQEVIGIARGVQLAAIKANGLRLRSPDTTLNVKIPCVADPAEISFHPDDAVLMTMKTQDTLGTLEKLRAAGVTSQPIFCVQNGVTNERLALRRFPEVHGVTVIMPASITAPGEISAFSTPRYGIFDIGRYPHGTNTYDDELARALEAANIVALVVSDVMQSKYGKLLFNLRNILEAACGIDADYKHLGTLLQAEAEAVYRAAGITWQNPAEAKVRREHLMRFAAVTGISPSGGSTTQSLARGAGSIETDYLNGEIVLLGRLHGIPVPANTYFLDLSARMIREKLKPGSISIAQAEADLSAASVALAP